MTTSNSSGAWTNVAILQPPACAPGAEPPDAAGGCEVQEGQSDIVFCEAPNTANR